MLAKHRQDHATGGRGLLNLTEAQEQPAWSWHPPRDVGHPKPEQGHSWAVSSVRTEQPGRDGCPDLSPFIHSRKWRPQPPGAPLSITGGKTQGLSTAQMWTLHSRGGGDCPQLARSMGGLGQGGPKETRILPCGWTALAIYSGFCTLTGQPTEQGASSAPSHRQMAPPEAFVVVGALHAGGRQAAGLSLSQTPGSRCSAGWLASDTCWWAAQTLPRPRLQAG